MKEEIFSYIEKEKLGLFEKRELKIFQNFICKTKETKEIFKKLINFLSRNFVFENTKYLLNVFIKENTKEAIIKKQNFFSKLSEFSFDNKFLSNIKNNPPSWYPFYDIIVVTENENSFLYLKKNNIPSFLINSERDLFEISKYDVIQAIDCETFSYTLEKLPQTIFLSSIEEVYLERYLINLSRWKENILLLEKENVPSDIKEIIKFLVSFFPLIEKNNLALFDKEELEKKIDSANKKIKEDLKKITLSGDSLVSLFVKGIPEEIKKLISERIKEEGIFEEFVSFEIPLKLNEKELDNFFKKETKKRSFEFSFDLKRKANQIIQINNKLNQLEKSLLYFDFCSGLYKYARNKNFPKITNRFFMGNSKNIFLENPQPISFFLDENQRGSILTGANSGGKTTLLEHILQILFLSYLGLPVDGEVEVPIFEETYYFAKNKGATNVGAFENLLNQMASIKRKDSNILILADEIEALTEPGVAGEVIAYTLEYFLNEGCFCVFATHLGKEIISILPKHARIDGIEAKGLDENFNLIVDHNPVIGKLANSTPELIIEKLAKTKEEPYFKFLFKKLDERKNNK
ncbi:MAG: hypothetical protein QW273_00335 [Candidatus Pacearchaeota archaeon]